MTVLLSSDDESRAGLSQPLDDSNTHITIDLSTNLVQSGYNEDNNGNEYDSTPTNDSNECVSHNNNSSSNTSYLSDGRNTNVKKRSSRPSTRNISSSSSTSPKKKHNKGTTSMISPIEAKKFKRTL